MLIFPPTALTSFVSAALTVELTVELTVLTLYTITEASIRDKLQLADATWITMLPNDEIFEGMGQMGYPTEGTFTFWKSFFTPQWRYLVHHLLHCISSKSGGWDQFGSNIATALICLSTDRVYNFSKLIFDGMVANLKSKTKFLMYPRFLQMILNIQTENKHLYLAVTLTKKIFGNMKRGFRGAPRPLLPAMLLVATTNPNAGQEHHAVTQSQPSSSTPPVPSTSSPPVQSPPPIPASIPTPTPIPKTEPAPFEHTFEEPSPVHQHFSPPQEQAHGQMTMDDLLQVVPQLISRIDSLETNLKQTKLTMGNAIVKLVKKVKKLEGFLKKEECEEVDTGAKEVNTAEGVNTRSIKLSTVSEQVSTGSAKWSTLSPDKGQRAGKSPMIIEETPKKIAEEEELNEQQKKRRAQVQFEAQHYTDEDWDLIRAKIEANAELSKSMLGSDLQGEDFAKKMVDLVNQRKKYFADGTRGRRRFGGSKWWTGEDQWETWGIMGGGGGWKNLSFEESRKGRNWVKGLCETGGGRGVIGAKELVPAKKSWEEDKKQMVKEGLHTDLDKDDSEGSDEVSEQDICTVYINFGAMLKDISRDDLTELYRIVMNRYGMDGPEDELEKVFWKYLKNMFEEPLSTDPIWSALGQQRIINVQKPSDKKLQRRKANENCYKKVKNDVKSKLVLRKNEFEE
ncbi:hypothetical protein Tco_0260926 [Tanacetum coccineum]